MSPTKMSRIESAMRVTMAFYEVFNRRDMEGILALMAEDCLLESSSPAPDGTVYTGKEGVATFFGRMFEAAPQTHIELEDVVGMGKRCVAYWRLSWTDSVGTDKSIRGVDIVRVQDELIREKLSYVKG